MDWEKKTAVRAELRGAASDPFNDLATPGQSLLAAVQEAEAVRKERYGNTIDAKMKAAREKLPALHPRHAVRSDMSIFTTKPSAEVHGLLPNPRPAKATMTGVKSMLQERMDRHAAVVDRFTTIRDACRAQLEQEAATAAATLKEDLEASEEELDILMSALSDSQLMTLAEEEVHNVWEAVAQALPERASWIDGLGAELEGAEERRRDAVESALVEMVAGLNDVAHLSEGEVERILEKESLGLNMAILANRKAYADLVARLHVAEVQMEQRRRQQWEEAYSRWRVLRTHHAMRVFQERIASPEFAEPSERLGMFAEIRERQNEVLSALSTHVAGASSLSPPSMSTKRVVAWREEAMRRHAEWVQELSVWASRLRSHEDAVEATAQRMLSALLSECLEYRGYSPEECQALVDKECGVVLQERREAALQLLDTAQRFLEWQAQDWSVFVSSVADWLALLATLLEEYKLKTGTNEGEVRGLLKARRERFNAEDAEREAALEAAVAAVGQASSEKELDRLVANALQRLDEIEAGYQEFHKEMTGIARGFPLTVQEANTKYHIALCAALQVKPQVELPGPSPEEQKRLEDLRAAAQTAAEAAATAAAAAAAAAAKVPKGKPLPAAAVAAANAAEAAAAAAEAAAAEAATAEPPPEPEVVRELMLPDSTVFSVYKDLLDVLVSVSSESFQTQLRERALQEAQEQAQAQATAAAAAAAAAAAEAAAAAAATAPKKGGKPDKKPPAKKGAAAGAQDADGAASAAAMAAAAAAEAETAAMVAAAVEAARAAVPEVIDPPTQPISLMGMPHCDLLELPEQELSTGLNQLQVAMLRDMLEFSVRVLDTCTSWAEAREAALTEELDAHLRAHRPRAGRIEEETRLVRSVELVAQRRKAENHMRAQSRAVRAQAESFTEWEAALRKEVGAAVERLKSYDGFLGQAMSTKSIEIRRREAEALRARIDRDLTVRAEEIKEKVTTSCARLIEVNKVFDAAELRTFEEGGQYAPENVATYRRSLAAVDAAVTEAQDSQLQKLGAAASELSASADEALSFIQSLLPSHREDMALVEKLDELMEAARRKARGELGRSAEECAAINGELDNLEALLHGADLSRTNGGASTAGRGGLAADLPPLKRCKQVLASLDRLRGLLYRQAKALDFLQSAALVVSPVDLTLDADGEPPPQTASVSGQPPAAGAAAGAKGKAAAASGAAAAALAAAAAAVTAGPGGGGEPLAKDIEVVIAACRKDIEVLAREYYAALFPPEPKGGAKKPVTPQAGKKPATPQGKKPASPRKGAKAGKGSVPEPTGEDDGPQPVRPIRYPGRIPRSLEALLKQTDGVLEGLREQLKSHVASGLKELRTQVIRAYRLVEHTPAVALAQLLRHELQAAATRHRTLMRKYTHQHSDLLTSVEVVRSGLHPRMINPTRRPELDSLRRTEALRADSFHTMIQTFAEEAVRGVEAEGPTVRRRLAHLVVILAQLLDSFLMPDDLPPIGKDEQYVYSLPGRKDDKQLTRLMLANAEAQGVPIEEPKSAKGPAKAGAKPPAPGKPGTPGTGGAGTPPGSGARPFSPLSWALPSGNFDLASLGWSEEEAAGLPKVVPLADLQAAAAGAATGPGAAAAKRPGSAAGKGAGAAGAAGSAAAVEPASVSGLDTPCHRAAIRAYRACLQQEEESMKAWLKQVRDLLSTWIKDEALWTKTWAGLMKELEGL